MTSRKRKKTKALGDDPLAWIKDAAPADPEKNTPLREEADLSKDNTPLREEADPSRDNTDPEEEAVVTLEPIVTISEAAKVFATFKALLSRDEDIRIDASKVQMLDTAGLQLLLCLSEDLRARNHRIHWLSPSPAFIQSAELAGLSELFGL